MGADRPKRIGLLVGGGPAPGLNGVIAAVTIEAINSGLSVLGCYDGFKWLARGDTSPEHYVELKIEDVSQIHLRGGSILRTSRYNPQNELATVLDTLQKLGVDALVSVGGDDTATSANRVHQASGGRIRVAHVPKTIDNDLPLPGSVPTFGFETARHLGAILARNLAEDARTTSRWYIIVTMGRSAGHLALGIGKAAAATITVIPEEFQGRTLSVQEVLDTLIGSIIKRRASGRRYGLAVLAEGLAISIGPEGLAEAVGGWDKLRHYGRLAWDKDDEEHGHWRLSELAFGRLIKDLLEEQFQQLQLDTKLVTQDLGYELRCADPIPFDAEYTRDLGYGAVRFLLSEESAHYGAVISIVGGEMQPLRFDELIDSSTGRLKVRYVNVEGEAYRCARDYMIRLTRRDFEQPEQLKRLAEVVKMSPEQFRQRFGYLVEHSRWD